MKKAIALIIFSVLLIIFAIFRGVHSKDNSPIAANLGDISSEVPTVVLPPEQLPQFKNISVYTPPKVDTKLFINPPDDNQAPTEESKSIQAGIM